MPVTKTMPSYYVSSIRLEGKSHNYSYKQVYNWKIYITDATLNVC